MSKVTIFCLVGLLVFSCVSGLFAQQTSVVGLWKGEVKQGANSYPYQLILEQSGADISGTAKSWSADGLDSAGFSVTGKWQGDTLVLREWQQTFPKKTWCRKRLGLFISDNMANGTWHAKGCRSGMVTLTRISKTTEPRNPILGPWTGHLGQSDRDYGFFLHFDLREDGTGVAKIESEGHGGIAHMGLNWEFKDNRFTFTEREIVSKTDPDWKWCLKSGKLTYAANKDRKTLTGDWQGYIEGFTQKTGACAPGVLYLEQPIPLPKEAPAVAEKMNTYTAKTQRTVNAGRVVTVQSPNLWILVWDNGTVDGDVMDLYLNGDKIIDQHRVTKQKYRIPVKLKSKENLIVLHALDLGDIKPNTVAVAIDDGVEEQTVIVSSNLRESGALMVRWFDVD